MTDLLRKALAEAESLRAVERATNVKRQSMMKFIRNEQSLRLDMADKLAEYFEIESRISKHRRKEKWFFSPFSG